MHTLTMTAFKAQALDQWVCLTYCILMRVDHAYVRKPITWLTNALVRGSWLLKETYLAVAMSRRPESINVA